MIRNKKGNSRFDFVVKNNICSKSKRSQVTIFIILALAILLIIFLLFRGDGFAQIFGGKSPITQIQDCVEESVDEAVDVLSLQGGSLNPQFYFEYKGDKIDYLCYTEEYYETCVMQKPLLRASIEKEIGNYIDDKVKSCVDSVVADLKGDGYEVSFGSVENSVDLVPGNIFVESETDLTVTGDTTESYKSIKTGINSKLYEMIMIASSIANWEARYGDSETMNYMIFYPSMKVEKKKQGDGTTIYILTDRVSLNKFQFASRSLVLPAGFSGN